jgi:aquaporin Z
MGALEEIGPYLAEFMGTFVLVFTIGCSQLSGDGGNPAYAMTAVASSLMVMTYALARISGGHFNPAVTIAVAISGKMRGSSSSANGDGDDANAVLNVPRQFIVDDRSPTKIATKVFLYVCSQVLGATLAALAYTTLFGEELALKPAPGHDWVEAGVCEALYTAMLCFVFLNVTAAKHNVPNQFYGLAIGFVYIAGGYAAAPISGGALNPAVSVGIDVSSSSDGTWWCLPYVLYQIVGALVACLLFRLVRPEDYARPPRTISDNAPVTFRPRRLMSTRLASEFIGTMIVAMTFGLNVLGGSQATAWSVAAALICMMYALGDVSGGHFNPAVTLGVAIIDRKNWSAGDAAAYMCIQVLAGINAGFFFSGMWDGRTFPLRSHDPFSTEAAVIVEFIFTFVIVLVFLSTAVVKGITTHLPRNFYFALAVGSCVTAGGTAAGKVSGGELNPALTLGISGIHELQRGGDFLCTASFLAVQLLAGVVGALIFAVTHEKQRDMDPKIESHFERTVD